MEGGNWSNRDSSGAKFVQKTCKMGIFIAIIRYIAVFSELS